MTAVARRFTGPTPLPLWAIVALVPTVVWLLLPVNREVEFGFDWEIYRQGFELWQTTGTPYTAPEQGWNPCVSYPYLYPPTSWPLLLLVTALPAAVIFAGVIPIILRPPRLGLVPLSALLLVAGLGPALYLANVNVLVAGLLVLAFLPGRAGGLALAAAVAIKGYPVVLLPFLWSDRQRLRWFAATLAALAVSGTVLFGPGSWVDFTVTLLSEGPHCDVSLNPFAALGPWRVVPAALITLVGLSLRSPTLTLLGATLATGVVTRHYLITLATTLPFERRPRRPGTRDGSNGSLAPETFASPAAAADAR